MRYWSHAANVGTRDSLATPSSSTSKRADFQHTVETELYALRLKLPPYRPIPYRVLLCLSDMGVTLHQMHMYSLHD